MWNTAGPSRELAACFNRIVKVPAHEVRANTESLGFRAMRLSSISPLSIVHFYSCCNIYSANWLNNMYESHCSQSSILLGLCLAYSIRLSLMVKCRNPLDDSMKRLAWPCFSPPAPSPLGNNY